MKCSYCVKDGLPSESDSGPEGFTWLIKQAREIQG